MEITPGTKNSHSHPIYTHKTESYESVVSSQKRPLSDLCAWCLNYTKTHTCTRTRRWLQCDERDGYPLGAGDQLGQASASISSSGPLGTWAECVCECEREGERARQAAKQPPPHQRMFPCSFSKHSLRGLFFFFGHIHPPAPYPFFFFFTLAPSLLPALLSKGNCWRPEYICLATAASTSHQPATNALPWERKKTEGGREGEKGWQRAEPTVLQGGGLRALAVEWI